MSSGLPESLYLDKLSGEDRRAIRPHPPAPLFPLAVGVVIGITADAAWALGTTIYISSFVAATIGIWLSVSAAARGGGERFRGREAPLEEWIRAG